MCRLELFDDGLVTAVCRLGLFDVETACLALAYANHMHFDLDVMPCAMLLPQLEEVKYRTWTDSQISEENENSRILWLVKVDCCGGGKEEGANSV